MTTSTSRVHARTLGRCRRAIRFWPSGRKRAGKGMRFVRVTNPFARFEIELLACRDEEKPTICLHTVVTGRQVERGAAFQEKKVRLVIARDFERLGSWASGPQPFPIKQVDSERQQGLDWTQSKRLVIFKEINPGRLRG
jgi:hypothetical protein